MKLLKLLFKAQLRAQWSLRLLVIAGVALAVSAQVGLETFSRRIEATVSGDTRALLSADFQIQAYREFPPEIYQALDEMTGKENYLRQTDTITSAQDARGQAINASLRAIEGPYPFYGNFKTEPPISTDEMKQRPLLLAEKSLKNRGYKLGDTLKVGLVEFQIAGFILEEPQTVASAFALGPRIIIHQDWLPKTQVIDLHSRAFRMLLIKSSLDQEEFRKTFRKKVPDPHWRVITPERANAQVSRVIERLRSFLAYVALAAVFLGSIGIFVIFRSQFTLKLPEFLSLRCIGLSRRDLMLYALFDGVMALLLGGCVGAFLGLGIESTLAYFAQKHLAVAMASVSWLRPVTLGFVVATFTVALGMLVPLYSTLKTPLSEILRPSDKGLKVFRGSSTLWILVSSLALIFITGRSLKLGLYFSTGMLGTSLILILGTLLLFYILGKIQSELVLPWKQSVLGLIRQKGNSFLLVLSLGLGIFIVSGILSISGILKNQIQGSHALGLPNFYVLSVSSEEKEKVSYLLPGAQFSPVTLARLKSLNGADISEKQDSEMNEETFLRTREYTITRRNTLSEGEKLKRGMQLFGPHEEGIVRASLEEKFAGRIGLKIGDTFIVSLSGVDLKARVDSFRSVDWFNFRPNFFIVFSEEDIADAPMDFVAVSRLSRSEIDQKQKEISKIFPHLTTLDGESIAQRILGLLNRLAFATTSVGFFSLAASLFVFLGLILTRKAQLTQEVYLWRCLGLSRKDLRKKLIIDLTLPTLAASATGLVTGIVFSWALATFFLDIPYFFPSFWIVAGSLFLPSILFPLLGWQLVRPLTLESPSAVFRSSAEII